MLHLRPVLAAVALTAVSCAPGVYVQRQVPAATNLGPDRRITLISMRGNVPGVEGVVFTELSRQVAARKHFALFDALPQRLAVAVPNLGETADLAAVRPRVDADFYLVATVTDFRQYEEPVTKNKQTRLRQMGAARLFTQLMRADGRVLLNRDFSSTATGPDPFSKDVEKNGAPLDMAQRAMRSAVSNFLAHITPSFVTEKIEFDTAEDLKPGIQHAADEDLDGALKAWAAVLAKNPNHAGAIYNSAVVYEVQGNFDTAKAWYRRAIELAPDRTLYQDAERALFHRLDDQARLQQKQ